MPRTVTIARRNSLQATSSGDVSLALLTIAGANIHTPITICNDVVNYVLNGVIFYGLGAEVGWISDNDRAPRTTVRMSNVYGEPGKFAQELSTSPDLKIQLFSDIFWSRTLTDTGTRDRFGDAVMARYSTSTPTADDEASGLRLATVSGDAGQIEAEIVSRDLTAEPWVAIRATPERLPILFR